MTQPTENDRTPAVLPYGTPPRYCHVDGMALLNIAETKVPGWDVFLGLELPLISEIALTCPTGTGHDVWRRDSIGEHWYRWIQP